MKRFQQDNLGPQTNREGMTFFEWEAAANYGVPKHRQIHDYKPWLEGVDQTEYAASWHTEIRMYEKFINDDGRGWCVVGFQGKERTPIVADTVNGNTRRRMTQTEIARHMDRENPYD